MALTPNTHYTLTAFVKGYGVLAVDVGGVITSTEQNSTSKFKLTSVSFNSGSATSATIYGAKNTSSVVNTVTIADPNFTNYKGNTDDVDWINTEGTGIGSAERSSNSASGADGSVKLRYKTAADVGEPSVHQRLTGIQPNAEHTFSLYVLEKSSSFSPTITMGVCGADGTTVVASKVVDYEALVAADAPSGDDSFRKDSLNFNSGANTSLTIFAKYNVNNIYNGGGGVEGDANSDVRVDDVALTYLGAPPVDSVALFDSFRLVSH